MIDLNFLNYNLDLLAFYFPLGVIGVWRWSTWLVKKLGGIKYRSQGGGFQPSVSIVTPVYNEDPKIFLKALKSWILNRPKEIIGVID